MFDDCVMLKARICLFVHITDLSSMNCTGYAYYRLAVGQCTSIPAHSRHIGFASCLPSSITLACAKLACYVGRVSERVHGVLHRSCCLHRHIKRPIYRTKGMYSCYCARHTQKAYTQLHTSNCCDNCKDPNFKKLHARLRHAEVITGCVQGPLEVKTGPDGPTAT